MGYTPGNPILFLRRDKGKGVVRSIPVFQFNDYGAYYYLTKKLEKYIAVDRVPNTFGGWSLGGAFRVSEDEELISRENEYFYGGEQDEYSLEYSFNPAAWSEAYGQLNSVILTSVLEGRFENVVEFDISNFYDSIRLDILEKKIKEKVSIRSYSYIRGLFHFLNFWNKENNLGNKQIVGIPQDAINDMSRILANYYLQEYDQYMFDLCNQYECKYLRYSDDQYIFGSDKKVLKLLLYKASIRLNLLSLNINQKKVSFRSVDQLLDYKGLNYSRVISNKKDKSNKRLVEDLAITVNELFKNGKNKKIKNNGLHLLNLLLFCTALPSIDASVLKELKECLLSKRYLKKVLFKEFNKLYMLLDEKEKNLLIKSLDELSFETIHNEFHYNVLNFYIFNHLDIKKINERIRQLKDI